MVFSQPALNAVLNGLSGVLLACGYVAIRRRKIQVHRWFRVSALLGSCAFLVSYLLYHFRVKHVILFSGQATVAPLLKTAEENGHQFELLAKPVAPDKLLDYLANNARRL